MVTSILLLGSAAVIECVAIIFLSIRYNQYKNAYRSAAMTLGRIISSEDSVDDAFGVLSAISGIDEGKLRRTFDELQASYDQR